MENVIQIMRTRVLSGNAPITGNSRVMRSDSIRNRPIEISTRMMTSAAISAVRKVTDQARAADHLGHGPRDQREVNRRATNGNAEYKRRDEEIHER